MARSANLTPNKDDLRKDQAAVHDAWFRSEIDAGLREADDPRTEWLSNKEVERQSALHRAEWTRQVKAGRSTD